MHPLQAVSQVSAIRLRNSGARSRVAACRQSHCMNPLPIMPHLTNNFRARRHMLCR
jgi:hypothetical protein